MLIGKLLGSSIKRLRSHFIGLQILLTGFIGFCLFNVAYANGGTPPTPAPQQWHIHIAPYAWIFGMKGNMTLKNQVADLDFTPIDVLKSIQDIDFIGQLHTELQRGPLDLMLDTTYLRLTKKIRFNKFGVDITPAMGIVDFGAYYTVSEFAPIHNANRNIALQVFGGGRYFYMSAKLKPLRLRTISDNAAFITPIIGGRLQLPLSENFGVNVRGDIGGFGIDDAKFTWAATILGHYRFHKHWFVALGYRWLDLNFSQGEGKNKTGVDALLSGPIIGFIFRY